MHPVSRRSPGDLSASYLRGINTTPLLTAVEERDLAGRIAGGDVEARDQFALANLRLVVSISRRYAGGVLPLEDLVAEGYMGLLRAIEGFDPDIGARFATYASYWIKQSLRVALNRYGHSVRLPQYMSVLLPKWRRAAISLRYSLGREPLPAEVDAELGLKRGQSVAVAKALNAVTPNLATGGDEGSMAALADAHATDPSDRLAAADDEREALGSLDRLPLREATVLRLRFGLGGGEPMTLDAIGRRFGLTRERARQIERSALTALRATVVA